MRKRLIDYRPIVSFLLIVAVVLVYIPFVTNSTYAESENTPSLVIDDDDLTFMEGDDILVTATCSAEESWVGLYGAEESPDHDNGGAYSLRWFYVLNSKESIDRNGVTVNIASDDYVDQRNGSIKAGKYKIILFGDGGFSKVLDTKTITVTEDPTKEPAQPSDELSLKLVDPEKTTYKMGEEVKIVATGTSPGAWVGLYKEDETPAVSVPSLRWYYINDGYNGVKVDITSAEFIVNNNGAITEGEYKILLFDADNYDNLVEELHIKIEGVIDIDPDEYSIEASKESYAYKEGIKVKASGTGIGNAAWVGLYTAETTKYTGSYLYYYYVRESNNAWVIMQSKAKGPSAGQYLRDGKYKLVIFADGGYEHPVKSVEIQVIRELKYSKVIRDPSCTTLGIEYVTYEDDTSEYREIPTLGGHLWGNPIKIEGVARHKYVCGRNEDHVKTAACTSTAPGKVMNAATVAADGQMQYVCDECGDTYTEPIPKIKTAPSISASRFVYSGKRQTPAVKTITDLNGEAVDSSMYTITFPKSSYLVGSYYVAVKFKGNYAGTYELKYTIFPKKVEFKKLARGKKSFIATWNKAAAQTTGYQIAYATNPSFKKAKYLKVKGISKRSAKASKLKGKKRYYVKVRAYKVVKGKTYYSEWSTVKTVVTKK